MIIHAIFLLAYLTFKKDASSLVQKMLLNLNPICSAHS